MNIQWRRSARAAAFEAVAARSDGGASPVERGFLESFTFDGEPLSLLGPRGIWKPAVLDRPISITTSIKSPYDDSDAVDGFLDYRYQGTDPEFFDNRLLRMTLHEGLPVLYFFAIAAGSYMANGALIVDDFPDRLTFRVGLVPLESMTAGLEVEVDEADRRYYYRMSKQRANQQRFRHRVLTAYHSQCGICRLKHVELLDAAHITPDAEAGSSEISNGIAMCKIHHAAFDSNIIGIRPDARVVVRPDVLTETDGPMLKFGLQAVHDTSLILPRRSEWQPNRAALSSRFDAFQNSAA